MASVPPVVNATGVGGVMATGGHAQPVTERTPASHRPRYKALGNTRAEGSDQRACGAIGRMRARNPDAAQQEDMMLIGLSLNNTWVKDRAKQKYTPVAVASTKDASVKSKMMEVVRRRVELCQKLAYVRNDSIDNCSWFSFLRPDAMLERNLRPKNVPIFVLSGGSSQKIQAELAKPLARPEERHFLAWHPEMVRGEPVYLMVHTSEYTTYTQTLASELQKYHNLFVVGWDGGRMTGFGAARLAALSYAETLAYKPAKILMCDQDVVMAETTRHTAPDVAKSVDALHDKGKQVVGYGVGFPTREPSLPTFSETYGEGAKPKKSFEDQAKLNTGRNVASPVQQFVSIMAPFRKKNHEIYPAYMVAGGEDMLMSEKEGAYDTSHGKNNEAVIKDAKIMKKELAGTGDTPNAYWNEHRQTTLNELYKEEQKTQIYYKNEKSAITIGQLCDKFVSKKYISDKEKAQTSALIIERIILKAYQIGAWPADLSDSVFDGVKKESGEA